MYYILNDVQGDGHTPVPVKDPVAWARWWSVNEKGKRVGSTVVGGVSVSTVFLGIDHAFSGGPPQLFETMIFGGRHDQDEWRCATWEEAEAMHEKVVAMLTAERRLGLQAHATEKKKLKVLPVGNKLLTVCPDCSKLIRLDKPIFGSLHLCV